MAGLLLAGLLVSACGRPAAAPGSPPPTTQAWFLVSDAETPPPDDAPWQPVSLPDDWSRTRPSFGGNAWYRIAFQRERGTGTPLVAIYVPRVNMVAAPFVNGERVALGGRFTEPVTRLWYRPQLFHLPARVLRAGTNVFHYRVRAYPDSQGGLSEVYIGASEPLTEMWREHTFRQVTAMQATTAITATLGVLVLVAWAVLQRNSAYGYFGIAALSWTVHASLVLTTEIPVSALYWETLIVGSLMWVVVAMMMFALRFAGLRRPWLERGAVVYASTVPFLLVTAGLSRIFLVGNVILLGLLGIGVYEFKVLLDVARARRTIDSRLLIVAALCVLVLGAHDWLNRQGAWAYAEPFAMHYGLPVLFLTVFWNLLGQASAARRTAEDLNRELEARVEAKTAEIERAQSHLRAIDAAKALAAERERIMRDMHDGVGSQLIAARQLAERGAVAPETLATMLDECISDLRLMIDSLEPSDGDLLTVLGNLRYRLTARLARQQLRLTWNMSALPPIEGLAPGDILQILRIVQEAVANVVKHARASEVVLTGVTSPDGRTVVLRVHDDGAGFPPGTPPTRGRGLGNMRQRAAAIGGDLRLSSTPAGTTVELRFPRPATAGSAAVQGV